MKKDDTGTGGISEQDLVGLLVSLKVEATPEANFEERFLYDLHERIAQESVCRSARSLLWDHVVQLFSSFGHRKLAYGTSVLGIGALVMGFFSLPTGTDSSRTVASAPLSRLERSLSSLKPSSGLEDVNSCTTITIGAPKQSAYTQDGLAAESSSPTFGVASGVDYSPVNMGLESAFFGAFQGSASPAY